MDTAIGQIVTNDIEHCQEIVHPWEVNLRQISAGDFHSQVDYVLLDELMFYREHWSKKVLGKGGTPVGYYAIGGPLLSDKEILYQGNTVNQSSLFCANNGVETDFVTPKGNTHAIILVPEQDMLETFGPELLEEVLSPDRFYIEARTQHDQSPMQFARNLNRLVTKYHSNPELLKDSNIAASLKAQLMQDISMLLLPPDKRIKKIAFKERRRALLRAIDIALSSDTLINVPQLARDTGVSQRVIELVFKQTLGITPKKFLSISRLHKVLYELQKSEPGMTTVGDTAFKYGFTELGRFANDYRRLFGEYPNETLKRASPQARPRLLDVLHRLI